MVGLVVGGFLGLDVLWVKHAAFGVVIVVLFFV